MNWGVGSVDFVFVDHARYLSDLMLLLNSSLLREGAVVVADNVKVPGARKYLAYMREREDDARHWGYNSR
jgi:catechol O-methyltransferase